MKTLKLLTLLICTLPASPMNAQSGSTLPSKKSLNLELGFGAGISRRVAFNTFAHYQLSQKTYAGLQLIATAYPTPDGPEEYTPSSSFGIGPDESMNYFTSLAAVAGRTVSSGNSMQLFVEGGPAVVKFSEAYFTTTNNWVVSRTSRHYRKTFIPGAVIGTRARFKINEVFFFDLAGQANFNIKRSTGFATLGFALKLF